MSVPEDRSVVEFEEPDHRDGRLRRRMELEFIDSGLDSSSLEKQSVDDLRASLDRLDAFIVRQQKKLELHEEALATESGSKGRADALRKVNAHRSALKISLERREQILELINGLTVGQEIGKLRNAVSGVDDAGTKGEFHRLLGEFESKTGQIDGELKETSRKIAEVEVEAAAMATDIDKYERKAKVWQNFLAKESVATYVGAAILLIMCLAVVAAMFAAVEINQVLSSAFLLVLGYFFGQSTGKRQVE
ncbi:hypothetical protein [Amycolatopsis sp. NPDC004079]|uniref:hypothetical protein n=1 Tax=Amycolatopsis sp. NPDC004079 TaxID=3154549 RepID=UPI0033B1EFCA